MRPRQKVHVTVALRPQKDTELLAFRQAVRLFFFELAKQHLRKSHPTGEKTHGQGTSR